MKRGFAPGAIDASAPPQRGGMVLRGIGIHPEARALRRPEPPPNGAAASGASRLEPARASDRPGVGDAAARLDRASTAGSAGAAYDEGYRAGVAEATRAADEDARKRGHDAGFAQGLEEGRAKGLEAGQRAVEQEARALLEAADARVAKLDALLSSAPAELRARVEAAEDDMVALCHAAVCRILGDQLVTRDGAAHALREAVREGLAPGAVAFHVHPLDLELLEADARIAAWLRAQLGAGGEARWVPDEEVGRGGCVVTSAEGTLDARLETRMEALRAVLSGATSPRDEEAA